MDRRRRPRVALLVVRNGLLSRAARNLLALVERVKVAAIPEDEEGKHDRNVDGKRGDALRPYLSAKHPTVSTTK